MKLGSTIKELRLRAGMKQVELANKCDITQTYLSLIESNTKEPNLSTIKSISDNLGIPLPILFFLSFEEKDVSVEKREAYRMMNPSVKSLINDFLSRI